MQLFHLRLYICEHQIANWIQQRHWSSGPARWLANPAAALELGTDMLASESKVLFMEFLLPLLIRLIIVLI